MASITSRNLDDSQKNKTSLTISTTRLFHGGGSAEHFAPDAHACNCPADFVDRILQRFTVLHADSVPIPLRQGVRRRIGEAKGTFLKT